MYNKEYDKESVDPLLKAAINLLALSSPKEVHFNLNGREIENQWFNLLMYWG